MSTLSCRTGFRHSSPFNVFVTLAAFVALSALSAFADSQARIVRLSDVQGSVQIDKNTGLGFENAFLNLPVTQGAQIRTRDGARAEIEFEDGSTLRLTPNTKVEFSTLGLNDAGKRISVINLVDGVAYVDWFGKSGDQFTLNFASEKVDLNNAVHFRVETRDQVAKFAVFKGEVQVSSPSGNVLVAKKKMVTFSDDGTATLAKNIEEEPLDSWDKEAIAYHDEYAKNNSSPYGYGNSDLGYYGAFSNVPGYGMMWQPFFTGVGWDPFMDGAWSWYPGMGYMFVSAYPWGWLPYRYGNWQFVPGFGWMWQPGYWNGWAAVPRYSGSPTLLNFHPLVVPTGTVRTIAVGKGGPTAVGSLHAQTISQTTISRGSAGLGIARGSLDSLKSLNHEVAKTGFAQVHPTPQFAGTAGHSYGSYGSSGSAASASGGGHVSSAGASHSSSGVSTGHH